MVVGKIHDSKDPNYGYNAATDKYEDLVKAGVIDPTKVTRTALQNAASIAGLMLTTEAMVADIPETKEAPGWRSRRRHGRHVLRRNSLSRKLGKPVKEKPRITRGFSLCQFPAASCCGNSYLNIPFPIAKRRPVRKLNGRLWKPIGAMCWLLVRLFSCAYIPIHESNW